MLWESPKRQNLSDRSPREGVLLRQPQFCERSKLWKQSTLASLAPKKINLSLLWSSLKPPQNFSTNLLFLWNNLSRSETSQKFQTNLVNFVTNFANFFLQKNIYFESKNHPKTKRLKNLKFCELCEKYFVNSVLQKLVPFRKTNSVNLQIS